MKLILLFFSSCLFASVIVGQKVYTLQECISMGMDNAANSISQNSAIMQADITANYAKWSFLPSIYASPNYSINYGRKLDPFTNTFGVNSVYSNTYGLDAEMTLFRGLFYFKQTKYLAQVLRNTELNLARKQEATKTQVLEKCIAWWKVQQKIQQQEKIIQNLARFRVRQSELVKEGRLSGLDTLSTSIDIKVQEVALQRLKNDLSYETIDLNFLIGLPLTNTTLLEPFSDQIEKIQLTVDEYYQVEELKGKLEIEALQHKMDRTQLLPSLVLNGNAGTGYSTNNIDYSVEALPIIPFRDQFNQNAYQGIGFYLSIPIFNKGEWYKNQKLYTIQGKEQMQLIARKEVEVEKRKLELSAHQQNLEQILLLQRTILTDKETIFNMNQEIYLEGKIRLSEVEKVESDYYSFLSTIQDLEIELLKLRSIVFK